MFCFVLALCDLEFPSWILLNKRFLNGYHSFIYSTRMYLVSAMITTALEAGNIVEIKEIPELMELLSHYKHRETRQVLSLPP